MSSENGRPKTAIVVVAHGSRKDPYEGVELDEVIQRIRNRSPHILVKCGCLRFRSPSFVQAAEEAIAEGVERLVVVPMFLFRGGHVLRDIPDEVAALQARYPWIDIRCASHIGVDERLVDIVLDRIEEVASGG